MASSILPHNTDPSGAFSSALQAPEPLTAAATGLRLRTKNGVSFYQASGTPAQTRRVMRAQSAALLRQCGRIDQVTAVARDAVEELRSIGFASTADAIEQRLVDVLGQL